MDYILYGGGTALGLVPLITPTIFPPVAIYVLATIVFISGILLVKKLPENKKQLVFYIPSIYALVAAFQRKSPRVGVFIILISMFCMISLMFDQSMPKDKQVFRSDAERTIFRVQILFMLGVAVYMFTNIVPLVNMVRRATSQ